MNFVSGLFIGFLLVVLLTFILLPAQWRSRWLTVASYFFYATWSIPFIGVILLTTTIDYWMSRIISASTDIRKKRIALILGLTINLGVLGWFKYANFLIENTYSLAKWLHLPWIPPVSALEIILPLGISFYTFEAISYMMDVYRGGKPAPNWIDYNFYIMYFPHLISGPVIRFCELWPQYNLPLQLPAFSRIGKGIALISLGYLFKILISDWAATLADPVFAFYAAETQDYPVNSILELYLGVLAFTVQIYFDFMGYTHIARGVSLLFNIELPLNFNHPYQAGNISDFWNRWHISLSRWIRDYLYIPLGGSRAGLPSTLRNLMITMTLCGAWHGAGWGFILWGIYHGLLLCGLQLYKRIKTRFGIDSSITEQWVYRLPAIGITFFTVMVGWVFFRAETTNQAFLMIDRLLRFHQFFENLSTLSWADTRIFQLLILLACCFSGPWVAHLLEKNYFSLPYWQKAVVVSAVAILCWLLTSDSILPFIYFQF